MQQLNLNNTVVPNMEKFIHDVSEYGTIGAMKIRLLRLNPLELLRLAWWNKKNIVAIAKKEFHAGVLLLIHIEILELLKDPPSKIIITDKVVDIALALNNGKVLIHAQQLIRDTLKLQFGIMTNNLPAAIEKCIVWKVTPDYIITPVNRFGYEMNPNQQAVEHAVASADPIRIVAITPEYNDADYEYLNQHRITKVASSAV